MSCRKLGTEFIISTKNISIHPWAELILHFSLQKQGEPVCIQSCSCLVMSVLLYPHHSRLAKLANRKLNSQAKLFEGKGCK